MNASLATDLNHHGSHRDLLRPVRVPAPTDGWVDLIVVPSSRPVGYLREAVRVARNLGCWLMVLASGKCSARDVAAQYGSALPGRLVAVDLACGRPRPALPDFRAGAVAAKACPRRSDVSLKRNLALLIGRAAGARRMLFLDDDIVVPDWVDTLRAASVLGTGFRAVGMDVRGYADNSVVCHANRLTGGFQETFVGAGALMVDPQQAQGFFPDIYNEDWFFLLDEAADRAVGISGSVAQRPYDPFATPARAEREEFGDILAEGLFWLLDEGKVVKRATEEHWRKIIRARRRFIDGILARNTPDDLTAEQWRRVVAALRGAQRVNARISPRDCADYLVAWNSDVDSWAAALQGMPTGQSLKGALELLAVTAHGSVGTDVSLDLGPRRQEPPKPAPLSDRNGRPMWVDPTPLSIRSAPPALRGFPGLSVAEDGERSSVDSTLDAPEVVPV